MFNIFGKKEQVGPEVRIIGGTSEETKKKIKEEILDHFGEKHLEVLSEEDKKEFQALEYQKTPEELKLIEFANKNTNELMEKAGVRSYDIPEKNIHIIPPDLYKKRINPEGKTGGAITLYGKQLIAMDASIVRGNNLIFGYGVFHEQMHLKGHLSIEAVKETGAEKENKMPKRFVAREGMAVESVFKKDIHGKRHTHFIGLHEGTVSYPEKDFFKKMLELSIFDNEKKWLDSDDAKKLKNKVVLENKTIVESSDDIAWVSRDGKDWKTYDYPFHQKVVALLTEEIKNEFSDKYKTSNDVFIEFLKSHFTGRLLNVAPLIEKTFGPGSFEVLGMMENTKDSAVKMLEYLRRARMRQLKTRYKT